MSPVLPITTGKQAWNHHRGQKGAVLIMALIILVVMTILGVTVMNTSSLEEKMAGNTQEHTRAFQLAETGLEHVRQDMTEINTITVFDNPLSQNFKYDNNLSKVTVETTRKPDAPTVYTADLDGVHSATDVMMSKFIQLSKSVTVTSAKAEIQQGISRANPPK